LKERRPTRSTPTSSLPVRQSHRLKRCIESPRLWDGLSPKLVISPSKKKAKTYAKIQIVHSKDDEEKAHSDEIGCGDDEKPQVEATQVDYKKELEVNPKDATEDIQVDVPVEPLILAAKVF
jgi:hypothetical protein